MPPDKSSRYFKVQVDEAVALFFDLTMLSLVLAATFPNREPLKNDFMNFLLYRFWPVVFITFWIPLPPMVFFKVLQFKNKENWGALLDMFPMFIVGCYSLYVLYLLQIVSKSYAKSVKIIKMQFESVKMLEFKDFLMLYLLWIALFMCFLLFTGGCIFYGEVLVPVWVPFADNEGELSTRAFVFVWAYETVAAFYMFVVFVILCPFIIVSTTCICKEIGYLIETFCEYDFYVGDRNVIVNRTSARHFVSIGSASDFDIARSFVDHHIVIRSALENVSRVNSCVFLVQTMVTVCHSCISVFNIYYTTNIEKVLLKTTPILFSSYFLMFAYCWNGQQLTNKSEELFQAVYRCSWYNRRQDFRTSLLIIQEVLKRPVHLTAGGLFPATFQTFVTCLQQSMSYFLVLKALTPEKEG